MDLDGESRSTHERTRSSPWRSSQKRSKQREVDSSSASIASSDLFLQPKSSNSSGIRASLDRIRDIARPSSVDTTNSQTENSPGRRSKLSKLIHSRSTRRKRKEERELADAGDGELGLDRGRSGIAKSGTLLTAQQASPTSLEYSANASTDSFGANKSGHSSLLTEDSEPEPPARPTLVSRRSHQEYLTLSSPLVEAETLNASSGAHPASTPPPVTITAVNETTSAIVDPSGTSDKDSTAEAREDKTPASPARGALTSILGVLSNKTETSGTASSPPSFPKITSKLRLPASIAPPSTHADVDTPDTPSTFVTPPTPDALTLQHSPPLLKTQGLSALAKPDRSLAPSSSLSHRRVRSALAAPRGAPQALSPAIEEAITPGGSLVQPSASGSGGSPVQPSGGFFSSLVSATQNAVNTLSNTISNPAGQRTRSGTDPLRRGTRGESDGAVGGEEVVVTGPEQTTTAPEKEPAIATLGSGNLSLSHLGIEEGSMSSTKLETREEFTAPLRPEVSAPPAVGSRHRSTRSNEEKSSAAEAISVAYSEKMTPDYRVEMGRTYSHSTSTRPLSIGSSTGLASGDVTPPRSVTAAPSELEGALNHRSGSIRSRLSDRKRRNRRSSTATGSVIAAALGASPSSTMPGAGTRRFSGFSQANGKRNKEFHQMFKSVPEDDLLIDDFSAALQRDILLQGRLYVSERHLCFASNILGWSTSLVIAVDEIVALEKKSTALIFPNAIVIQTLHTKNTLASLINRDNTYELILNLWKIGHPNIKATENGHTIDNGSPASSANNRGSGEQDSDVDDDEISQDSDGEYDDDEDGADTGPSTQKAASVTVSETGDAPKVNGGPKQASAGNNSSSGSANSSNGKNADSGDGAGAGAGGSKDYPGPATHSPTECSDQDTHYEKQCIDATIPAPLGKVYSMMFGPQSGAVMRKFLLEDQKSSDLQMEDDKKGLGEDAKTYSYSFIKPLSGSIGPKQTKCIVNQTLDAFDLEKAVSVTASTQTPDVPSGSSFVTKTRYCLTWASSNSTRLLMSSTCEWSAKSWLKGPIEKGAAEGQEKYGADIAAFLKAQLGSKSSGKKGGKVKGRKKRTNTNGDDSDDKTATSKSSSSDKKGGLPEMLSSLLGDAGGNLLNPTGILSVLLVLVTLLWIRSAWLAPSAAGATISLGGRAVHAPRALPYEDLWAREENDLWNWLEDRINLDSMVSPVAAESSASHIKRQALKTESMEAKLGEENMSDKQLDNAVRVTEEKLEALKAAIEKKKSRSS